MNRYQASLNELFSHEVVTTEDKSLSQVLGELLKERELTVSSAESCTGGNIAHKIVQVPGSSAYFLGSVVSYSNDVKADVLKVSRSDLDRYGAVSKEVVEQMAEGVARLMRTDCAIATSGIAGPEGGTRYKPVGTVWIAARIGDRTVSECVRFSGNRDDVIESATNHGMVMLINLLRNSYTTADDINDD
ncbi:MAG: CinA family protein [Muribaculaceae bacterium]|nr:CinA family protein [Muribaculaceae bacterium]